MAVDLSVFGRQKSLIDQQQLQAAFEAKKVLQVAQLQRALNPTAGQLPAAIQEDQYFQKLDPLGQQRFLNVKRASQVLNLGNQMAIRDPSGGLSATYDVGINPNNDPALRGLQQDAKNLSDVNYAANKQQATAAGKAAGEAMGALGKKGVQANEVLNIIGEAEPYLNDATGSKLGAAVAGGKQVFGTSDKSTQANAALQVLGGRLVSSIPRMEGPQSDADVRLYREQAARLADPTVPAADKRSALSVLKKLNGKYATSVPSINSNQMNMAYPDPTGGAMPPSLNASSLPSVGPKQAPDGHYYVPDPQRPGKFLKVD